VQSATDSQPIVTSTSGRELGPLPAFLATASSDPVTRVRVPTGDHMWLVRDHALGRSVLSDTRFSRAAAGEPRAPKWSSVNPSPNSIMSMDGAPHARLRRIAAASFTTRRVAEQASFIGRITDDLLDALEAAGRPADLVAGLTSPLPLAALGALLGVPTADRPLFDASVIALFDMSADGAAGRARHELNLVDYMSSLVGRKRRDPQDDVLSTLIRANDGGVLSHAELISFGLALLMAGYETTAGQLSMAVLTVLADDAWRVGALDETAIEDLIRVTPAAPMSFPRVAVESVELGGTLIRAGEAVIVSLLHCNFDAGVFPDPDDVRGDRHGQHLTFGHGVHRCLGAPLARLQMKIALARLRERFPELRIAQREDAVVWRDGLATRGLANLEVEW
jgi:cytochrome P450